MSKESVGRAVNAAIVPMVAALGAWGVTEGHWLPDRDGSPVVWLRVRTSAQRLALAKQIWLVPQVQVTLTRLGVPHDVVWRMRVELSSAEDEARLFVD